VVCQSSWHASIATPNTSPAGTHPAMISLAKSCPDTSEVKGSAVNFAPRARTAVPSALNSCPPRRNDPRVTRSPTTPSPPSSAHWAAIRSIAVRLAWSMARTSGPNGPGPSGCASLGQLYPSPRAMPKTAAPNT
jgi:hypothetical protein